MQKVNWTIKDITAIDKNTGVYFLRTNVRTFGEQTTWEYYNLIREIECTNRQLKTDLNLRPIYHQKDERSDAHLFFGLLSYWVVNTIRFQLKQSGETLIGQRLFAACLRRNWRLQKPSMPWVRRWN